MASVTFSACVCVKVCVFVHAVKGKRLELSYTNLNWYAHSMAGPQHALPLRPKGQRSRSRGNEVCCLHGNACRND